MTEPTTAVEKPALTTPIGALLGVVAMVAVMWVEELVDLIPGTSFDSWGIQPRTIHGLVGIPLAPFLHAGFGHLIANTIPFVVLGGVVALSGSRKFWMVTVLTAISGTGTWLFDRGGTVHIGASGLVLGYLTYLLLRGLFARKPLWIIGGVVVGGLYGGLLWGLLPATGISFTGHLFGAIGGVVAARSETRRAAQPLESGPSSPPPTIG